MKKGKGKKKKKPKDNYVVEPGDEPCWSSPIPRWKIHRHIEHNKCKH